MVMDTELVVFATGGDKEYFTVDDYYCNPDSTLVLISKEKMAFRIEAWPTSRQRSITL